jgi:hypothetical protein
MPDRLTVACANDVVGYQPSPFSKYSGCPLVWKHHLLLLALEQTRSSLHGHSVSSQECSAQSLKAEQSDSTELEGEAMGKVTEKDDEGATPVEPSKSPRDWKILSDKDIDMDCEIAEDAVEERSTKSEEDESVDVDSIDNEAEVRTRGGGGW